MSLSEPRLTPELKCDDFEKSLHFYSEILGFNVSYTRVEHGFAMFEYQGADLMIDRDDHYFTDMYPDTQKPYGRGLNLQIQTDDVEALYARVKSHGWPIAYEMEEAWYRANDKEVGNKQFIVQDPDGYLLRFFENMGERPLN